MAMNRMLLASYSRNILKLVPMVYEVFPYKNYRFNMETLWFGRIITPKCLIAAIHY